MNSDLSDVSDSVKRTRGFRGKLETSKDSGTGQGFSPVDRPLRIADADVTAVLWLTDLELTKTKLIHRLTEMQTGRRSYPGSLIDEGEQSLHCMFRTLAQISLWS